MRRPSHTPISRRLGAVALSITILWVVFAAAGSDTSGDAGSGDTGSSRMGVSCRVSSSP